MREIVSGVYANNALVVDIFGKTSSTELYTYFTQRDRLPSISKYPLVSKLTDDLSFNVTAYQKYYPKHSFRYDTLEDNDEMEIVSTRRQSQMNQFKTNTLTILVNGDSNRRVGDMVELLIPSMEDPSGIEKDFEYDRYLSGNYMVTKINHSFTHNNYELIITLVKDSYAQPLSNVKQDGETVTLSDNSKSISAVTPKYTNPMV